MSGEVAKVGGRTEGWRLLLPYFVPYLLWVGFSYANRLHPQALYVTYPLKTIVVGVLLICLRKEFPELRWRASWHGVWVGLVAWALWIIPWWRWVPGLPKPAVEGPLFDPLQFQETPLVMVSLILFRLGGAALVVPVFEELLFRSCIARLVIDPDFRRVPVGTFTRGSLVVTTVFFMFGHQQWEWIGAFLVGLVYYGLVVWRRNILDSVIAHGVTNLALGIYVLSTRQWWWW